MQTMGTEAKKNRSEPGKNLVKSFRLSIRMFPLEHTTRSGGKSDKRGWAEESQRRRGRAPEAPS